MKEKVSTMSQSSGQQKESPETVLLRHPLPKYKFKARKLPKESPSPDQRRKLGSPSEPVLSSAWSQVGQPGAVAFPHPGSEMQLLSSDRKSVAVKPFTASRTSDVNQAPVKPVAAVVATNLRTAEHRGMKFELGGEVAMIPSAARTAGPSRTENSMGKTQATFLSNVPGNGPDSDIPVPDAGLLAHVIEGPDMAEKLERAEKEIAMLRSQLEVQLQVNAEIKRLLVASVGDDFERKVENLARDRAQLALDLGDFTKKMTEDYEHLDQISIQADMWRSKYLASRVMVEELASGRAFYSSQFHDSQNTVQSLLNERYELRSNLLQSYKCLQQVKEAFDPLNAQKSHSLPTTNVLDLAQNIKQLSEAVRFRLLPAHASSHIMLPLEDQWEKTMTQAELLAYEQLSKQTTPPSFKHTLPTPSMTSSKSFERFHPMARHDNVTLNCCNNCKGEIKVA